MILRARCRLEAQGKADEGLASAGDTLKGQPGGVRFPSRPTRLASGVKAEIDAWIEENEVVE